MMTDGLGYVGFVMIMLTFVFLVNGCTEEIPVLEDKNRMVADSIIRVQSKNIEIEIDSLCGLGYKAKFDLAVDSVSKVRLKEIEKYIPTK